MGSMGMQVTNMEESYGEDGYDYGGYEGDGQGYEGMAGLDPGIVDHSKGKIYFLNLFIIDHMNNLVGEISGLLFAT